MSSNHPGEQREALLCKHPYATLSANTKDRERRLDKCQIRTEFQRDIHRIAYSQPFRRLRHKTQVFYLPNNDHICTRLEHSVHVANAARTVARALQLNEDLAEAIGLGHDLGHAPFGHHGEEILSSICRKKDIAEVFHHEVNSLRVIDRLAGFDRVAVPGLNLTWEVRDGIVSHNGEDFTSAKVRPARRIKDLSTIKARRQAGNPSTLEGCIVRMVDKVSYAGRDVEDAIQAGMIVESDIPPEIIAALGSNNGQIVDTLIRDIIASTPNDGDYIAMSQEKFEALNALIKFNYEKIYMRRKVEEYKKQASLALLHLFEIFQSVLDSTGRFQDKTALKEWPEVGILAALDGFVRDLKYIQSDTNGQIVLDFISGFTDRYVLRALEEVFVPKPTA